VTLGSPAHPNHLARARTIRTALTAVVAAPQVIAPAAYIAALPQLPWMALPTAAIPLATAPIGPGTQETYSATRVTALTRE
jgi:hypothetical protein